MKIKKLAYNLYCKDALANNIGYIYTKLYFCENIKDNELCLSYYKKACVEIRIKKLKILRKYYDDTL